MEKFLLRATGRVYWSYPIHKVMASLVKMARDGKLNLIEVLR